MMGSSFASIASHAQIRVLLVPVGPIKYATFKKHATLVQTFNSVRLGDVTPDLKKGANAMFSSQVFQEGQLHFNFVSQYSTEQAYLEEFQMHRRIYGVIGIMDCQEWKEKDMSEGFKQFSQDLSKYPTVLVSRCFAFDPLENQPDTTKGLVMIPNFGDMSFYMSTMMCDFASSMLTEFGNLAADIDKRQIIESPQARYSGYMSLAVPRPASRNSMHSFNPPDMQPSVPQPAKTSLSSKKDVMPERPEHFESTYPALRSPSIASTLSPTSNLSMATSAEAKVRKRTPARGMKLIADLYLLSGRLPDAVTSYTTCIELLKSNSDYLWQASALEGLCCAYFMAECLNLTHLITNPAPGQAGTPGSPSVSIPGHSSKPLLIDLPEKYATIMQLLTKYTTSSGAVPCPSMIPIEAYLKIARFLATVWWCDGWNEKSMSILLGNVSAREDATPQAPPKIWSRKCGVSRPDIASWVMRAWNFPMDDLTLTEQIQITTVMASIMSFIGYPRKHAFFLRQTALLVLPLLFEARMASSQSFAGISDRGILECLKKLCSTYGIEDLGDEANNPYGLDADFSKGWPELQVDVLRECITVSEALSDYPSMLSYTATLLRKFYRYLPKDEQVRLATSVPRIVSAIRKDGKPGTDIKYWGYNMVASIEVCMQPQHLIPFPHAGRAFANQGGAVAEGSTDPFIYNPFSKKKDTEQIILVANEMSQFTVTLINPFAYDLDVQSLTLSTSGAKFEAVPLSVLVPASSFMAVQLSGTPLEAGELDIRGCLVRVAGCTEQEFPLPSPTQTEVLHNRGATKIKKNGLDSLVSTGEPPANRPSQELQPLKVSVVPKQPLVKIASTSLLHGAIDLFEGETTSLRITLENASSTPVDFVGFSFFDSTTVNAPVITPEIPPEDIYELDLFTKGIHALSWEGPASPTQKDATSIARKVSIPPGGTWDAVVNVFGKRGCTSASIQIDYGYMEREEEGNVAPTFYTRRLFLPFLMTVHQNLEVAQFDLAYLGVDPSLSEHGAKLQGATEGSDTESLLIKAWQHNGRESECCLMTLDVKNIWSRAMDVSFRVAEAEEDFACSKVSIEPDATKRIVLPLPRISLSVEEVSRPIPTFEQNKQFVVSATRFSEEQEKHRREQFWYREALLKRLQMRWHCPSTKRCGTVFLRPMVRFLPHHLETLKRPAVEMVASAEGSHVRRVGPKEFQCEVDTFVSLSIGVVNRLSTGARFCVRLLPVQTNYIGAKDPALGDKLLYQGVLQAPLSEVQPGDTVYHHLQLCCISCGRFKILYHVENLDTGQIYTDHEQIVLEAVQP
ncbi:uncharacterized protein VTP21DRAFT_2233 [Calcarisporiella thermophila]|uniref:uncharacterized protein n=1 Tax=Calcarisporiella thermophila TaxID=911321 RepID=UPI0037447979